jgi:ABC-2 type transport system ATP-binding protein
MNTHMAPLGVADLTSAPAMIEVRDLVKEYGKVTAVGGISFTVRKGEVFALLGPNGAGKTTTIKVLTTLLPPTRGGALVGGMDVVKEPHEVKKMFGIVFQESSLDDEMTAMENLNFYSALYGISKPIRAARGEELLKEFELWDRRNERVKAYSGGMRRRLEIIRSLMHTPQLLVLDEPTVGLDPQARAHLWRRLQSLNANQQMTIFLTTHYLEEVERVAHRLAIIDHGILIAEGTADEIKERTQSVTLDEAFIKLTGEALRS